MISQFFLHSTEIQRKKYKERINNAWVCGRRNIHSYCGHDFTSIVGKRFPLIRPFDFFIYTDRPDGCVSTKRKSRFHAYHFWHDCLGFLLLLLLLLILKYINDVDCRAYPHIQCIYNWPITISTSSFCFSLFSLPVERK